MLIGDARVSKADGSKLIRERTQAQVRLAQAAMESKKAMFPTGVTARRASSVPLQPSG